MYLRNVIIFISNQHRKKASECRIMSEEEEEEGSKTFSVSLLTASGATTKLNFREGEQIGERNSKPKHCINSM